MEDGLRYLNDGKTIQRYLCRDCGFRFSETTSQPIENLNIPKQRRLKTFQPSPNLAETPMCDPYFSLKEIPNDSTLPVGENITAHDASLVTVTGKNLNTLRSNKCNSRVCVRSARRAKNSVSQAGRGLESVDTAEKRAAGATAKAEADVKGKIVEFLWWIKNRDTRNRLF